MKVDHICFAVKDLALAIGFWTSVFGYEQMTKVVVNKRQLVNVVFMKKKDSILVKLIEPLEDNISIKRFVVNGGGFHHLCFRCSNLEKGFQSLKKQGLITLVAPQPGEAFENEDIAFLLTKFGFSIELIDTTKKSGLLDDGY